MRGSLPRFRVIVNANRLEGSRARRKCGADVAVLDERFSIGGVARKSRISCWSAPMHPTAQMRVLPGGPLREPLDGVAPHIAGHRDAGRRRRSSARATVGRASERHVAPGCRRGDSASRAGTRIHVEGRVRCSARLGAGANACSPSRAWGNGRRIRRAAAGRRAQWCVSARTPIITLITAGRRTITRARRVVHNDIRPLYAQGRGQAAPLWPRKPRPLGMFPKP